MRLAFQGVGLGQEIGVEIGFVVRGGNPLQGADLDVSSDHRVAMTAAVLACAADGESILRGFDVAGVSYPDFVDVLRSLGASVEELA